MRYIVLVALTLVPGFAHAFELQWAECSSPQAGDDRTKIVLLTQGYSDGVGMNNQAKIDIQRTQSETLSTSTLVDEQIKRADFSRDRKSIVIQASSSAVRMHLKIKDLHGNEDETSGIGELVLKTKRSDGTFNTSVISGLSCNTN